MCRYQRRSVGYTYANADDDSTCDGNANCDRNIYIDCNTGADHTHARGYKVHGLQRVDLFWSGPSSSNIDIYRNGVLIATVPNIPGFYTDHIGRMAREPIPIGCALRALETARTRSR